MARRQYPCLHGTKAIPDYAREEFRACAACDKEATHWATISWSYMRGEDDSEPVCQRHERMAWKQFSRFMAHIATKEKFLKGGTDG